MGRIDVVKTEVFKFDELSEEAKQTAIEIWAEEEPSYDWWDCTYEDAGRIGLKITGFDLQRFEIDGEFTEGLEEVCRLISKEHGQKCDTYQTAAKYLEAYRKERAAYVETFTPEDEDEFYDTDIYQDMEFEFKHDLLEDYRIILSKEFEYLTSEEAIIETINANEYEFTADGKMY